MSELESELDALAAETAFSGVIRVDLADRVVVAKAYGLAHRGCGIPNTVDTRFAIASGTKGLTALTVVSLIEEGRLELATPARSVLEDDLLLIPDDVTVEHLLAHRSGIGDYLDEESELDLHDYLMPVPVHELAATEQYLTALDGHEPKFPAGERFAYCNSGYVVLALIAERVTCVPFHELVGQRVCGPAEMGDTEFLRSDELPDRTAIGYLAPEGSRTNVFHLPVRGSGDGGIYSTAEDIARLWRAFFAGRIVSVKWVAEMVRPRSLIATGTRAYGLGFWLDTAADSAILAGSDAGVSFRTEYRSREDRTTTLISNTTHGAWSIAPRSRSAGRSARRDRQPPDSAPGRQRATSALASGMNLARRVGVSNRTLAQTKDHAPEGKLDKSMALILKGKSKCAVCGQTIRDDDEATGLPHFATGPEDVHGRFSDAPFHLTCYLNLSERAAIEARLDEARRQSAASKDATEKALLRAGAMRKILVTNEFHGTPTGSTSSIGPGSRVERRTGGGSRALESNMPARWTQRTRTTRRAVRRHNATLAQGAAL